MNATITRRVSFTGPTNRVGGNPIRAFDAGTPVWVRQRQNGRYELRVQGTLWVAETNHLAFKAGE